MGSLRQLPAARQVMALCKPEGIEQGLGLVRGQGPHGCVSEPRSVLCRCGGGGCPKPVEPPQASRGATWKVPSAKMLGISNGKAPGSSL